jgi:pimeloyl-ACP methyl ester carboxylesterase
MARFVLVHGAFTGAWIWGPLAERLRAAGHSVEALDLPGSGDDQTPASEVTLDACASRLCEVLASSPERAIVVGNSMGGVIVTQGAVRSPERVAALVYATAFIPADGQSLLDLANSPDGAGDQVQANIIVAGDPPVATMPAAASGRALYGSCSQDVAAWAIARQRPQPVAPFATPVSIPPGALNAILKYYVVCLRDQAIMPKLQRRMIADNPCAAVVELDTDHTPHLSMPDELAKALDGFAKAVIRAAVA